MSNSSLLSYYSSILKFPQLDLSVSLSLLLTAFFSFGLLGMFLCHFPAHIFLSLFNTLPLKTTVGTFPPFGSTPHFIVTTQQKNLFRVITVENLMKQMIEKKLFMQTLDHF